MYTVIDIETNGGNKTNGKITEIAVIVFDGKAIVDSFETLINPESFIPGYITQLTGITNQMVENAPKFRDVAQRILAITEGKIFVAHNVSFDYNFIQSEFKRIGIDFQRKKLCTVQLSRKHLPGYPSYSLGKICAHLDIKIEGRHRAYGDAYATTKLFQKILTGQQQKDNLLF